MTKENPGCSSVAVSAHALSLEDNGLEVPAQDAHEADDAAPNMSQSTSSNANQNKPADTEAPAAPTTESQPMTAPNSPSSDPSATDDLTSGTSPAAPYGTRSRNRSGTNRPNYAEDKEIDAEFEIVTSLKEGRKAIRGVDALQATLVDAGKPGNSTRKVPGPETDQVIAGQPHFREPIPGTSTFSANFTTTAAGSQSSKKRKANGAPATSHLQPPIQFFNHGTIPAVTRRASIAAQGLVASRETNMLSFDDCGSRLNKEKKLIADDGTVLEVNGKSSDLLQTR